MYRYSLALIMLALILVGCAVGGGQAPTIVIGEPISVGDHPSAIAVGEGAVWVTNQWGNPRTVSRIDPETREVVATIPVSNSADTLAVGEGAVWVLSTVGGGEQTQGDTTWPLGSVCRIDPETNHEVAKIPVGWGSDAIAVGEGAVWVTNDEDGTLMRIDPKTNQVVATIPIAAISGNKRAFSMAVGESDLWIASGSTKKSENEITITRVDPKTDKIVAAIPITGARYGFVATGEGSIWVAYFTFDLRTSLEIVGSVIQIDPDTNEIMATIPVSGDGIAVGAGSVCVINYLAGTLTQIDAKTNEVVGEPIIVGTPPPVDYDPLEDECSCPNAVAVGEGTVWVVLGGDDVVKPIMLVE